MGLRETVPTGARTLGFDLDRAASARLAARRTRRWLDAFPDGARPASAAETYAIQDRAATRLGPVGGWKVGAATPTAEPFRAPIPAEAILRGPAAPASTLHVIGVEAELAYRFDHDLPRRTRLARKATGERLGILGMGRIGRAVARRAEGFGMAVSCHSRNPLPDATCDYAPSPLALAQGCDILVVAAAGGPASRGRVSRAVMDALGPACILVDVARGTVVDEAALVAALPEGTPGGVGLDVSEDEPNVPDDLMAAGHAVLQPHRASATVETRITVGDLALDELAALFAGREPPTAMV